ncbi:MAG: glycosyltransferase family 4 protein [Cytophagaceae bacterium]
MSKIKVCAIFEIASDEHVNKDVIQVPLTLAKLSGAVEVYLIARPNGYQKKLKSVINLIPYGEVIEANEENIRKHNFRALKTSADWYSKACRKAADYGNVLFMYPHFGNPVRGAWQFKLRNYIKFRSSFVYLKMDTNVQPKFYPSGKIAKFKEALIDKFRYFYFSPIDVISTESSESVKNLKDIYPALIEKIKLVKNCPVNIGGRQELNRIPKEKVFINVGRLGNWQKATDVLLLSWIIASEDCKGWKLKLVGPCEESFKNHWLKVYEKCGLADRLIWKGPVHDPDQLAKEYSTAECFVLTSRHESGPLVFSESVLRGCSFISTPVGEIPSIFDYEKEGIFPIDNVEGLVKLMIRFANDDSLRRRQSEYLMSKMNDRTWEIQLKQVSDQIIIKL